MKEFRNELILCCSSTSPETKSSSSAASATKSSNERSAAAAAALVTGSDPASCWELEVFGTWRALTDVESAQIEKAYCDPSNDTVSTSVAVSMLSVVENHYHHCQIHFTVKSVAFYVGH